MSGYSEATRNVVMLSNLIVSGDSFDNYHNEETDELINSLKRFWETESIGITNPNIQENTNNEIVPDIKFNGEHY